MISTLPATTVITLRNWCSGLFGGTPPGRSPAGGSSPFDGASGCNLAICPTVAPSGLVLTVGTATLAAFIGGGGYGELIVRGLALNDNTLILSGAAPAAIMALVMHGGFEVLDRYLIPEGLRKDFAHQLSPYPLATDGETLKRAVRRPTIDTNESAEPATVSLWH